MTNNKKKLAYRVAGKYNGFLVQVGEDMEKARAKKMARAAQEYARADAHIAKEYQKNPEGYIVSFYERKSKVENSSPIYAAVGALAINLSWQFISSFLSTASFDFLPDDFLLSLKLAMLAMNFIFLGASVAVLYVFYSFNRHQKRNLLIEEHIMKKRKYI
ncbi:MAG: hypothetical protein RR190_06860 [Bacteroidales bacterium]